MDEQSELAAIANRVFEQMGALESSDSSDDDELLTEILVYLASGTTAFEFSRELLCKVHKPYFEGMIAHEKRAHDEAYANAAGSNDDSSGFSDA
jgi:hypothetical protein